MNIPYKIHSAANLFPMLGDIELKELSEDIAKNGLIEPIWLSKDNELLDGRNRYLACKIVKVKAETRTYRGDDPIGFVCSLNMHRRHLTAGQKAIAALEIEKLYATEAKERQREAAKEKNSAGDGTGFGPSVAEPLNSAERQARASRTKAAKAVGTSADSVAKAKKIANRAPDLLEKVQKDEISLNKANEIVKEREQEKREKEAVIARLAKEREEMDLQVIANGGRIPAAEELKPKPHEYKDLLSEAKLETKRRNAVNDFKTETVRFNNKIKEHIKTILEFSPITDEKELIWISEANNILSDIVCEITGATMNIEGEFNND